MVGFGIEYEWLPTMQALKRVSKHVWPRTAVDHQDEGLRGCLANLFNGSISNISTDNGDGFVEIRRNSNFIFCAEVLAVATGHGAA
jgi:hypothetical protein